jgi:hypothetical protein
MHAPHRPSIPASGPWVSDIPRQRMRLRLVAQPPGGTNTKAPPVLNASSGTIDYTCGRCGTVLMHANEGEVHGVVIECLQCGAFNATDMLGAVPLRRDKLPMSDDSKRYRRYAEECRRLADKFGSVEDRATLLNLAQAWEQLADQAGEDGPKRDRN